MIVTLKTLQQQTFKIEIDGEATVKVLKEKIEKEKGVEAFPAGGQKLIYAGKILEDEKPISLYKIEEKTFVVVMITKPKPANSVSATASSPSATEGLAETPLIVPSLVSSPSSASETSEPPSSASSTTDASFASESSSATATENQSQSGSSLESDFSTTSAESALVTGQQYEDVVEQMVNMGFPREQVQRALRASFNNPDRAVEYLFNGIPELFREEQLPVAAHLSAADVPASGTGQGQQPVGAGAPPPLSGIDSPGQLTVPPAGANLSGEEALAFLRDQPQFQHMRNLIQTNPQLLPELLQQIGHSNPHLLQRISQNQEQFIAMLNEQYESAQGGAGSGGISGRTPGDGVIQVTLEEKEAIERLKVLGFSEAVCIQAYFACDKNEELAANYLLSHGFDDDDS